MTWVKPSEALPPIDERFKYISVEVPVRTTGGLETVGFCLAGNKWKDANTLQFISIEEWESYLNDT